jgi:hypothetical protein
MRIRMSIAKHTPTINKKKNDDIVQCHHPPLPPASNGTKHVVVAINGVHNRIHGAASDWPWVTTRGDADTPQAVGQIKRPLQSHTHIEKKIDKRRDRGRVCVQNKSANHKHPT